MYSRSPWSSRISYDRRKHHHWIYPEIVKGWYILRANNPLHADINHRKRTMRNTWHFFEGRPDRHRLLPNTESVWPSNVQSRKLLFFPPLTRSVLYGEAPPTPFQFPVSTKRNIYKYFTTKNFLFTQQHAFNTVSSVSWQPIFQFPSFPAVFEDVLPFRLSHHRERTTPEIRQRIVFVCQSRFDFPFVLCVFHFLFYTLTGMLFKHQKVFLCATLSDCIWEQYYFAIRIKFTSVYQNFCPDKSS